MNPKTISSTVFITLAIALLFAWNANLVNANQQKVLTPHLTVFVKQHANCHNPEGGGAKVTIYYVLNGQNMHESKQADANGIADFTAPHDFGTDVTVGATYGEHSGMLCWTGYADISLSVDCCLNDIVC